MKKNDEMLSRKQLMKTGWTDHLIDAFLPEPDETRPSGPLVKYYRTDRIAGIKSSRAYQDAAAALAARRQAATDAMHKKLAYIEATEIKIPKLGKRALILRARDHFLENPDGEDLDAPDPVIARNYVLKTLTREYFDDAKAAGIALSAKDRDSIFFDFVAVLLQVYPWMSPSVIGQ